jgi:hypothetical protein
MRTILCWAGIAALAALGWSADITTPAKGPAAPKKTVAKPAAPAAKKKAAPSKTGVSKAATASGTTAVHPAASRTGVSKAAMASRTTPSHPGATKTGVSKGTAASRTTAAHPAPSRTGVSKAATAPRTAASHPGATKAGSRTTASRRGKKGPAKRVTWRNRQLAPTPQRYQEIQQALAAKGYLNPEDANGTWNQASVDALKKFQAGQNLDSTGKINSLSLIALGLGPRRETAAPKAGGESPPAPGP